jgi:F-type H+-transporting ATPase subunit gamma
VTSAKEIKSKIISVINTKKITKSMEMIAIAKMRKAEARMFASRPYSDVIKNVINHVMHGHVEYQHCYLNTRKIKRIGMIIVSTDKGLCGSLNTNLFKQVLLKMHYFYQNNISCDLILFGLKSLSVFEIYGSSILAKITHLGDNPDFIKLKNVVRIVLKEYRNCRIDQILIAFNKFQNKMIQYPQIYQLLPFVKSHTNNINHDQRWDYLYETDSKLMLDMLFNRYAESQIYQSVLENIASEHSARMVAMKTATDNSSNRIKELQLIYNKVRQANITQELIEIIAGAAAVSVN